MMQHMSMLSMTYYHFSSQIISINSNYFVLKITTSFFRATAALQRYKLYSKKCCCSILYKNSICTGIEAVLISVKWGVCFLHLKHFSFLYYPYAPAMRSLLSCPNFLCSGDFNIILNRPTENLPAQSLVAGLCPSVIFQIQINQLPPHCSVVLY